MTPEPSNEYQKLVEAVARAEAWLRQCSDWLLATDLDMQCPMETDPLDIAAALSALKLPHAGDAERQLSEVRRVLAGNPELAQFCQQVSDLSAGDDGWQDIATAEPGYPYMGMFWTPLQPERLEIVGPGRVKDGVFRNSLGKWDGVKTVFRLPLPTPPAKGTPHV